MCQKAAVVYLTKLSQYWQSRGCVNYEKPTPSQGQKVETGVSRIRTALPLHSVYGSIYVW